MNDLNHKRFTLLREAWRRLDPVLFFCCLYLSLLSILTIFGAVDNFGKSKLVMQVFIFFVGNIMMTAVAYFDYRYMLDKWRNWIVLGCCAILLYTAIAGSSGASRETSNSSWLTIPIIGIAIQPSEFVKVLFICTFAHHLWTVKDKINQFWVLVRLAVHALLIVGPILISGDLGVALVYLGLILMMLYCAGMHWGYFLAIVAVGLCVFPFLWDHLQEYQRMRIIVGFNPSLDPKGYGWQALLSRKAIADGGFFGVGWNTGGYYETLSCSHTDFIFATICEKFGFLGGFSVIVCFLIMIGRCFYLGAVADKTDYGGFICAGVGGVLFLQVVENIGMCCGLLPVIGITLPLLSCGGSSMLATYLMFGVVHSVHAHSGELARRSY